MEEIFVVNWGLAVAALLGVAAILSSRIASRLGMPLLVIFMAIGMFAGEDGPGGVLFDNYRLSYLIGSAALSIILFDGGLRTRYAHLRPVLGPALMLSTLGVMLGMILTALFCVWMFEFNLIQGLLLGVIVAPTDAAAILFLLRSGGLELKPRIVPTLEAESGTNDPVAMFLTLALVQVLASGGEWHGGHLLLDLLWQGGIGAAIGLGGGWALSLALNHLQLANGLHPILAAIGAVALFGGASSLDASGFLAAYLGGLVLGNRPLRNYSSIVDFHNAASWLAQLAMFVVLGLLATPSRVAPYFLGASGLILFLILVARPLPVFLCLWPFHFHWREKLFISWVGLRGAVSIFLAIIPILYGLPNASHYFDLAFFVVFASILLQGGTGAWMARKLGLTLQRSSVSRPRLEIDVPDAPGIELIGYRIGNEQALLLIKHLPEEARLSFIRRKEGMCLPEEWKDPQIGDTVYFVVRAQDKDLLDQAFALQADLAESAYQRPLFSVQGDQTLARLADFYDLILPPARASQTIGELFDEEFAHLPRLGDRLAFAGGWLIAIDIKDARVVKAGFLMPEEK